VVVLEDFQTGISTVATKTAGSFQAAPMLLQRKT
jgi:hypothetical protein